MESKKKDIKVRLLIRKVFGKIIPEYQTQFQKPYFKNYLRAIFVYLHVVLSSKKSLCGLMVKLSDLEMKLLKITGGNK